MTSTTETFADELERRMEDLNPGQQRLMRSIVWFFATTKDEGLREVLWLHLAAHERDEMTVEELTTWADDHAGLA